MLGNFTRQFSTKPHIAGSDEDLRLSMEIKNYFQTHNFHRTVLKNYTVLLSLPNKNKPNIVSIVNPSANTEVYTSKISDQAYQPFCLYSPPGDVTVCTL